MVDNKPLISHTIIVFIIGNPRGWGSFGKFPFWSEYGITQHFLVINCINLKNQSQTHWLFFMLQCNYNPHIRTDFI